ncbi:hypothetical protein CAEBREN_18890 [Caenorhabditis brenneri]|uniref:Uncharacterized protein n=1 Tax=Caenorhabditis brenneri TaxID=135651 RepID=G0MNA7_CAEBE|nr:hypothetical protein CAEBREN_18890 [Caenorhabditis brenneri]
MLNFQNFVSTGSQDDRIAIRSQNPTQIDLIRRKIETELVGDWKNRPVDGRYLRHPENPHLILEYFWWLDVFFVEFSENSVNAGSLNDRIYIRSLNPIQIDLISQKIETELVGEWKGVGHYDDRYLVHPNNPNLVLVYAWDSNVFVVGFLTLEEFNKKFWLF